MPRSDHISSRLQSPDPIYTPVIGPPGRISREVARKPCPLLIPNPNRLDEQSRERLTVTIDYLSRYRGASGHPDRNRNTRTGASVGDSADHDERGRLNPERVESRCELGRGKFAFLVGRAGYGTGVSTVRVIQLRRYSGAFDRPSGLVDDTPDKRLLAGSPR
jgi:hypothetical protein